MCLQFGYQKSQSLRTDQGRSDYNRSHRPCRSGHRRVALHTDQGSSDDLMKEKYPWFKPTSRNPSVQIRAVPTVIETNKGSLVSASGPTGREILAQG
jgi:hypothetical protein